MSPDDARHGAQAGYAAGCREQCCKTAHALYMAQHRVDTYLGRHRTEDSAATIRRIRALMALGYTMPYLSSRLGRSPQYVNQVFKVWTVRVSTAQAVSRLYDELSMTVPTGWTAERQRRHAEKMGYAPPLAWDDISNPHEQPQGMASDRTRAPGATNPRKKEAAA